MENYQVRDISLAPSGHRKIQWVRENMPLLRGLEEEFKETKPFEGVRFLFQFILKRKPHICVWCWRQEELTCQLPAAMF